MGKLNPFRKEWYSICSKHQNFNNNCEMCHVGYFANVWVLKFQQLIFKYFRIYVRKNNITNFNL